jgi:hypothetical protein
VDTRLVEAVLGDGGTLAAIGQPTKIDSVMHLALLMRRALRLSLIVVTGPILLTIAAISAATVLGGSAAPTKGRIPDEAISANGDLNFDLVPDYVLASGRDGSPVGYVTREAALDLGPMQIDGSGRPVDVDIPVYADDLTTVVGYMVPGRGFVPLGTDPKSVPTFEVHAGPAEPISR